MIRVPFENVSKLLLGRRGVRDVPDIEAESFISAELTREAIARLGPLRDEYSLPYWPVSSPDGP
jgi:hypothetical protein